MPRILVFPTPTNPPFLPSPTPSLDPDLAELYYVELQPRGMLVSQALYDVLALACILHPDVQTQALGRSLRLAVRP